MQVFRLLAGRCRPDELQCGLHRAYLAGIQSLEPVVGLSWSSPLLKGLFVAGMTACKHRSVMHAASFSTEYERDLQELVAFKVGSA